MIAVTGVAELSLALSIASAGGAARARIATRIDLLLKFASVDGAPQKLVTDYLEVEALFERLPLQEEVFVELLPAKKKR